MANSYLDKTGLALVWVKIKELVNGKVVINLIILWAISLEIAFLYAIIELDRKTLIFFPPN